MYDYFFTRLRTIRFKKIILFRDKKEDKKPRTEYEYCNLNDVRKYNKHKIFTIIRNRRLPRKMKKELKLFVYLEKNICFSPTEYYYGFRKMEKLIIRY